MPFCSICGYYAYGPGHQCPPVWDVWQAGEEEDLDPKYASQVRADDSKEAAEKAAKQWDDNQGDGPSEYTVFVRAQGEEGEAVRYCIEYDVEIVYSASQADA